jgi:hypothetical protein
MDETRDVVVGAVLQALKVEERLRTTEDGPESETLEVSRGRLLQTTRAVLESWLKGHLSDEQAVEEIKGALNGHSAHT